MYTGRSIEDLLELVLERVEGVGDLVFVAPKTTVPLQQNGATNSTVGIYDSNAVDPHAVAG